MINKTWAGSKCSRKRPKQRSLFGKTGSQGEQARQWSEQRIMTSKARGRVERTAQQPEKW